MDKLEGLRINTPSTQHKVILALFADDATVFLSKNDNLETLFKILNNWCIASGAKFNEDKTVVILVGSKNHRTEVGKTCSLNITNNYKFPHPINILKDGGTTCCLRAQAGNDHNRSDPWPNTIEKIENSLQTWEKAYPSLDSRKHIIQMTIGGMTQFLTVAQGMPQHIEKHLTKRIRTFMWNSKSPPQIASNIMYCPPDMGGRNILDLPTCNEAIKIMKLKKILDHSDNRPAASDTAIAIIIRCLPNTIQTKNTNNSTIVNIFLQSVYTRNRYTNKTLPSSICEILNISAKYHLSLEAPKISLKHKVELPAWHHIGKFPGSKNREYTKQAKCLQTNHKVTTVADLIYQENLYKNPSHSEHNNCQCPHCTSY